MKKNIVIIVLILLCSLVYARHVLACTEYFSGNWPSAVGIRVHITPSADPFHHAVQPWGWNYASSGVFISSVHSGAGCSTCKIRIKAEYLWNEPGSTIAITDNYVKWLVSIIKVGVAHGNTLTLSLISILRK